MTAILNLLTGAGTGIPTLIGDQRHGLVLNRRETTHLWLAWCSPPEQGSDTSKDVAHEDTLTPA
jgi:hypothetical protein